MKVLEKTELEMEEKNQQLRGTGGRVGNKEPAGGVLRALGCWPGGAHSCALVTKWAAVYIHHTGKEKAKYTGQPSYAVLQQKINKICEQ